MIEARGRTTLLPETITIALDPLDNSPGDGRSKGKKDTPAATL
jgi:hypothetical protein